MHISRRKKVGSGNAGERAEVQKFSFCQRLRSGSGSGSGKMLLNIEQFKPRVSFSPKLKYPT
jgi:hypothetical protein